VASRYAVGPESVDGLCKALGLPDDLPVRSVVLRADCESIVTVAIEIIPDGSQMAAVGTWLAANRERVLLHPAVTLGVPEYVAREVSPVVARRRV